MINPESLGLSLSEFNQAQESWLRINKLFERNGEIIYKDAFTTKKRITLASGAYIDLAQTPGDLTTAKVTNNDRQYAYVEFTDYGLECIDLNIELALWGLATKKVEIKIHAVDKPSLRKISLQMVEWLEDISSISTHDLLNPGISAELIGKPIA